MPFDCVDEFECGPSKAHSVFWMLAHELGAAPVEVPLLVTRDSQGNAALSIDFLLFAHDAAARGVSRESLSRAANIVGLMADYAVFALRSPIETEDDIEAFLSRFLAHRFTGTISPDGSDDTGLRWRGVRWVTVRDDRKHALEFIDFCVRNRGHYPSLRAGAVPSSKRELPGRIRFLFETGKRRLLDHLARFRAAPTAPTRIVLPGVWTPKMSSGKRPSSAGGCLPESEVTRLISQTRNPVYRAIFILIHYGGPRLSECLHLWVDDVLPVSFTPKLFNNAAGGVDPLVVLAHPTESTYTGAIGDWRMSRLQRLASMGLVPRVMLPKSNKLWAGWKGMAFDNPNILVSKVFWADPTMARLFRESVEEILDRRERLPAARRHPWLFVCLDRRQSEMGQPIKVHRARNAFYAACARAGIEPHRNHATTHRGRSHYDQLLVEAGFDPAQRSELLHQRAPASEAPYGHNVTRLNEALSNYFATKHRNGFE